MKPSVVIVDLKLRLHSYRHACQSLGLIFFKEIQYYYIVLDFSLSFCRLVHSTGCPGHGGREEMAGDGYKRGQPEGREERRGLPLALPGPGE